MSYEEILDRAARKAIIKSNIEKTAARRYHSFFDKAKHHASKQPVRESLKAGVEKAKPLLDNITPMSLLGIIAGGVIVNQFVNNLMDAGQKLGLNMMKPAYYKKMLESNPKLMEEDEEKIARL